MYTLLQRKSKSLSLPSTDDQDTRMPIWQDSYWFGHRMWNFQFRQWTHPHYNWSSHRMAKSLSYTWKVSRYHSIHIHKPLSHILLDNGMEFKTHLMDQVLQQLRIDGIFSAPHHPQSNGKLEVFHKYLKPTLKKLCEKDPSNWEKYINQVLTSYRVTPNLAMTETPFFLVYGRDPNLPLHQLLEMIQQFLGDLESGLLNL